MPQVLTHRGLEPAHAGFYLESSIEAFSDQLRRGFGIEFDANFLKDGTVVVTHDSSLSRISNGADMRALKELTLRDFSEISFSNGRLGPLSEVLPLIVQSSAPLHALHLKGVYQREPYLSFLCNELRRNPDAIERLLIFDVTPTSAKFLLDSIPNLQLAPSVAHPHDIARYSSAVADTLLSVQQVFDNRGVYRGVWLDEWDRVGPNDSKKTFYTSGLTSLFADMGLIVGLVTPELHGTSPGLMGGEAHEDSQDASKLFERIREIVGLKPDLICTDYPEEVRSIVEKG